MAYHSSYQLGPHKLNWTTREKDLGVWITDSFKPSSHCQTVYKKASGLLSLLRRMLGRFTPETLPLAIITYIRLIMK